MKASELIKQLQQLIAEKGDCDVETEHGEILDVRYEFSNRNGDKFLIEA